MQALHSPRTTAIIAEHEHLDIKLLSTVLYVGSTRATTRARAVFTRLFFDVAERYQGAGGQPGTTPADGALLRRGSLDNANDESEGSFQSWIEPSYLLGGHDGYSSGQGSHNSRGLDGSSARRNGDAASLDDQDLDGIDLLWVEDDISGATIILPRHKRDEVLEADPGTFQFDTDAWRAFAVHLGPEGTGLVNVLASALASEHISILNFTTVRSALLVCASRRLGSAAGGVLLLATSAAVGGWDSCNGPSRSQCDAHATN